MKKKTFNKIQQPLMIKIISKVNVEKMYLNILKPIYDKPTANIIFSMVKS